MLENNFPLLKKTLDRAERILLISHKKPDADACGAILSLSYYLKSLGKKPATFVFDLPPAYFGFLPAVEELKNDPSVFEKSWDAVVVLDTSDWLHTGVPGFFIENSGPDKIINIDHHATNKRFGALNLVEEKASSTCEIIYRFFEYLDFKIDRRIAICLLNGIIGDTNGLFNAATSAMAIKAAANLILRGAKIHKITDKVVYNKSIEGLKLWGLILSRLKFNRRLNLAYTYIREEEFKTYGVKEDELDGAVDFFNVVSEVSATLFFRLNADQVKVSLRTVREGVDVAALALLFGGGGHKKAAGFSAPWKIEEKEGKLSVV